VLLFIWNVVKSLKHGVKAGDNPWDAPTLEWATPSPPPPYNFMVIPSVGSRHPLWEDRLAQTENTERSFIGRGLTLEQGREALGTTPLDAEPNVILKMPDDTLVPLCLALAMTALTIGLALVNWLLAGLGVILAAAAITVWLWPSAALGETAQAIQDG
jgi:cytochrome c oxidase subunit 1/cytochrome c oxidase subunit I+III